MSDYEPERQWITHEHGGDRFHGRWAELVTIRFPHEPCDRELHPVPYQQGHGTPNIDGQYLVRCDGVALAATD